MVAKREVKSKRLRLLAEVKSASINTKLGQLCVKWAALEYVLFILFYRLSGLSTPVARSVFYSQSTNLARINLIHSVYPALLTKNYKPLAVIRKIKKALDALAPLATARNRFIHDPWGHIEGDPRQVVQLVLKTKGAHGSLHRVKASEISDLTARIESAGKRIVILAAQLTPLFEASRERLRLDPDLTLSYRPRSPRPKRTPKKRERPPQSSRA